MISILNCREKMAFFTRKGLTVPEFPNESVLTEEPEEFNLPSTPSSLATPDESTSRKTSAEVSTEFESLANLVTSQTQQQQTTPIEPSDIQVEGATGGECISTAEQQKQRFEYVVDRTYGVEVWSLNPYLLVFFLKKKKLVKKNRKHKPSLNFAWYCGKYSCNMYRCRFCTNSSVTNLRNAFSLLKKKEKKWVNLRWFRFISAGTSFNKCDVSRLLSISHIISNKNEWTVWSANIRS